MELIDTKRYVVSASPRDRTDNELQRQPEIAAAQQHEFRRAT